LGIGEDLKRVLWEAKTVKSVFAYWMLIGAFRRP
jgi:hypothetical protein